MKVSSYVTLSAIAVGVAVILAGPSQALTMKECSAKYKEAEKAGTLKGMKWNDFRKAECGASAAATTTAAPAPAAKTEEKKTEEKKTAAKPAMAPSKAVFPTAVSSKYSKESAGKARMHTCLDQYNANKATNANGGMKWIEKGGGYYSECNKRIKG